jgi:hypothetical protein
MLDEKPPIRSISFATQMLDVHRENPWLFTLWMGLSESGLYHHFSIFLWKIDSKLMTNQWIIDDKTVDWGVPAFRQTLT